MTRAGALVTASVLTHNGAQRPANEDAVVVGSCTFTSVSTSQPHTLTVPIRPGEPVVVAVADGLGGHRAGEVAAAHVVRQLASAGSQLKSADDIAAMLQAASKELTAVGRRNPEQRDMGTTVAGLLLFAEKIIWFNVGDSRVYRLEGGYLGQMSIDDTPTAVLAEAGEAAQPTETITQAIGTIMPAVIAHTGAQPVSADSTYLLCSDGLSDLVEVAKIEQILSAHAGHDPTATRALWAAAMNAGGRDNITVVLLHVRQEEIPPELEGSEAPHVG
jgi:PPM family protein phosphatase